MEETDQKQNNDIMLSLGRLEGLYTGIVSQMTTANGRTGKLEIEVGALKDTVNKHNLILENTKENDGNKEKQSERRKDWVWGAVEKIIFAVVGAGLILALIVLQNLHIVNLTVNQSGK
jgi:hypothetical protein